MVSWPQTRFRWPWLTARSALKASITFLSSSCAAKAWRSKNSISFPPGVGFLLVEFGAWTAEEAQFKAESLLHDCHDWPVAPAAHICTAAEAASVWYVRESALGAVVFVPGEPDRWEGWEDAAVPPDKLGAYLRSITELMNEYGYRSPLYGHYGQGCVHMRINFDFRSEQGLHNFREFLDRATDVVLHYGGSLSGEHGDGQARAALLPKMFGPELMQAFREFKALWDPDNRMNPGKLIDAVRVYDPVENLRHGIQPAPPKPKRIPRMRIRRYRKTKTQFAFAKDDGSFTRATERCVGVGACRKTEGGVMCPSYRATGQEQHSTRGRARLLWEMLEGALQRGRIPERGCARGSRPLPQLQSLQDGVPGAGRHGRLQIRVPRAALQRTPPSPASLRLRFR